MNVSAITKVQPSEEDVALAREARRALETVLKAGAGTRQVDFRDSSGRVQTVRMPASALQLLQDVLDQIEKGCAVSIVPTHTELTTQEAAQMLGVSRPFFVQMLERGDIPFHKIGTHRRVRYRDVVDYKKRLDAQRHQALEELATQAQALDMGY
ncbi:helix-turn-helix domain-containing protein [Ralstonia solanacearum]|uniref:helix-turn-helix domain-containing protein n=1 Tax=Ralstonia solanacearum TaxID=305 RepID=UPI0005C76ADE|nr:helix-turn-helix domain-containing protein [Ralstonia solanacearum]MBB6589877.1 helix-turn-helix domain-containing protein [Ralstonia solanacearum]MBB6594073.1 helix-turn-helix domain-containing protein [Ralstonia solanacearum]MDB0540271.1 helix-turn-helix domain-containing protein [Ralstonia solanacearum]MDB0550637.1 helix-turn-helix domain-containing protein [Ralstonia solanacearum]MDB0555205.1 helix-turn-helix domain-containing protein [Ralstonia solanacearum]